MKREGRIRLILFIVYFAVAAVATPLLMDVTTRNPDSAPRWQTWLVSLYAVVMFVIFLLLLLGPSAQSRRARAEKLARERKEPETAMEKARDGWVHDRTGADDPVWLHRNEWMEQELFGDRKD